MNSTVDEFLTSLVGTNNWNAQFVQMREWAAAGQVEHILAVAAALTDPERSAGIDVWVQQSIFDSIVRSLAGMPGLSQAEAALAVVMMPEPSAWPPRRWSPTPRWHAKVAEYLAQWQPPDVLLSLFESSGYESRYQELLACLVQEMALRGYAVTGAAADFWQEYVVNAQHPLGWLPTALLAQEKMFPKYLPRHRTGWAVSESEDEPGLPLPDPVELGVRWTDAEVLQEEKTILEAAVLNWTQKSNGKIEAHLFRSDTAVPAAAITPAAVLALPLECLAETSSDDLRLLPYSVGSALSALFSAASNGGAYNSGLGVPYGRIEAWRSGGALVGADKDADIHEIASLASKCVWFCIIAKSKWFHNIFWDLGLLALRPDGRTLAVLAATDTD